MRLIPPLAPHLVLPEVETPTEAAEARGAVVEAEEDCH